MDTEGERLAALYGADILDSEPEDSFEELARLAAAICRTPISQVNLIDAERQWTKAAVGMARGEVARGVSFCARTIREPEGVLVVEDAARDARFAENPLVLEDPGIRFYAGASITSEDGHRLGAVCVVDLEPRELDAAQLDGMQALARIAADQLRLRRLAQREQRVAAELVEVQRMRDQLTQVLVHDVRSPLMAIRGYGELLQRGIGEPAEVGAVILGSAEHVSGILDALLQPELAARGETVDLAALLRGAVARAEPSAAAADVEVSVETEQALAVTGDHVLLARLVDNLLGNAIKYGAGGRVALRLTGSATEAVLEVEDYGVGIPERELPHVFDRFFRASTAGARPGTGLGLASAKAIVDAHGGTLSVASREGEGSTFRVCLRRATGA
jgi:signal transduction histidine kinase